MFANPWDVCDRARWPGCSLTLGMFTNPWVVSDGQDAGLCLARRLALDLSLARRAALDLDPDPGPSPWYGSRASLCGPLPALRCTYAPWLGLALAGGGLGREASSETCRNVEGTKAVAKKRVPPTKLC